MPATTRRPGPQGSPSAETSPGPALRSLLPAHVLAGLVVVIGLGLQIVRPLVPELAADLVVPPDPGRWFDAVHLERAAAYRTPIYAVALLALALRLAVPLLVALTATGRRLVDRLVGAVGEHRPARAAAAVVASVLVLTDLAVLPLAFWAGYVHEGEWGFRTHGLGGWARDWLVANGTGWLLAAAATATGYALARRLPVSWPPVAALGGAAAVAVLVMLAPLVVEPLWFRTVPLPDGPTRTAVAEVVERSGERIDRILVADASRRTTKHNAYVSGLGATRRLVLYDTLVAERPAAEVAMVVAHELGHHRHGDLGRGTATGAAGVVLVVYVLAHVVRRRSARGRQRGDADPRAAALVLALILVMNVASLPVQNAMSRRAEAAADFAALELTRDPETYIGMHRALAEANLGNPAPPSWVVVLWGTHPTVVDRLELGERWAAEHGLTVSTTSGFGGSRRMGTEP